jgi:hypothetical protein
MCVCTEERCECANLVPPHQHIWLWVAEEPPDVSYKQEARPASMNVRLRRKDLLTSCIGHASDVHGEHNFDTHSHVFPCAEIVAGPHSAEALRAGVESASEDKRTCWSAGTCADRLISEVGLDEILELVTRRDW